MLSVGVAAEVFSVCVLLHGGGAVDSTEKHLKSEGSTVFVTQQQEKGESDRRRLGAPRSTRVTLAVQLTRSWTQAVVKKEV